MVTDAQIAKGNITSNAWARSIPYTSYTTRTIPNAPALTTATACRSALTGAGATIDCGSQPCSGNNAALTPNPATSKKKMIRKVTLNSSPNPASEVPSLKSTLGTKTCNQTEPSNNSTPPLSV